MEEVCRALGTSLKKNPLVESFFQWMEVLLGFPTCQEVLQAEQEIKLATIFSVPKNHFSFGIGWKLFFF
jgi:hypothetical protein